MNCNEKNKTYKRYVGPSDQYDMVAAMVFNLLTCLGLRHYHRVIDIGCGSLRVGRLLIPYLDSQNYIGVEPNRTILDDGIVNEIGTDFLKLKKPILINDSTLKNHTSGPIDADFIFAQSIFSHCGLDLIDNWLSEVAEHLSNSGVFVATFHVSDSDYDKTGWVYPGSVAYQISTIQSLAKKNSLNFRMLDWSHPRQNWCIFWKDGADTKLFKKGMVSWNNFCAKFCHTTHVKNIRM